MPLILELLEKQAAADTVNSHTAQLALSSLKDPKLLYSLLAGAGAGGLLGAVTPVDTGGRKLTPAERRNRMLRNIALFGLGGAGVGAAGKLGYDFLTDPTLPSGITNLGDSKGYANGALIGGAIGAGLPLLQTPFRDNIELKLTEGNKTFRDMAAKLDKALGFNGQLSDAHVRTMLTSAPTKALKSLQEAAAGLGIKDGPLMSGMDEIGLVKAVRSQDPNLRAAFRGAGETIHPEFLGRTPRGRIQSMLEGAADRFHFSPTAQGMVRPIARSGLWGSALGLLGNAAVQALPSDELIND